MARQNNNARQIALGGILAAVAVVVMCLGGLIPVATYLIPMICGLLCGVVCRCCGKRIAWAWYGAVSILGLLLGPDKEAAALFLMLGYYPVIKPKLDKLPLRWLWKLLVFNAGICAAFLIALFVFGMTQLATEFKEMGIILLSVTLVLGNLTFILFDRLLLRFGSYHG